MKAGMIRKIFAALGYLGYTLAVLALLLWFLFPAASVRAWLETQLDGLNPELTWKIRGLGFTLPVGLVATDIRISNGDQTTPLLRIDRLAVRLDPAVLLANKKEVPLSYTLQTLGGTVKGKAFVARAGSGMRCSGTMRNLQIGRMTGVWREMGRTAAGSLSGRFTWQGEWRRPALGALQADIVLSSGDIGLQRPILSLDRLKFNRMSVKVSLENGVVTLADGKVGSRLFSAGYGGTVTLMPYFQESGVNMRGFLAPRPELLSRLHDDAAVSLIREQLQDGKLSFTVSGTLLEPGILFHGISGVIDGVIERSAR
ncbi:MAG TPA: type II secretion system protein GspN [Desulfobacteraceae bacterium]|nr:type II secretion system protein GspN [Desulfobacteraceae bacterium]